jgi:hypothetical protein
MKTKRMLIFALLIIFFTWQSASAEERNFPAGSLIIPMDSYYQPDADGGILEAYGLVYYLLSHQDETCLTDCADDEACRAACDHDLTVYWIINQEKVAIDAADFVIEDLTVVAGENVAELYDHAGGVTALTYNTGLRDATCLTGCAGDEICQAACPLNPDSHQKMTYSGGPWIVEAADAAIARTIINQAGWAAVEVHVAQVPFKAPVYREMKGTPPRIALMNNSESLTDGNATILESYLRLAGICTDVYDVVTPNMIRDGILLTKGYDFLWAPHWTGYGSNKDDDNGNGLPDVEDIVIEIRKLLENGKGLLGECASIEVFEHSPNGRFLSTKGFGHNDGTNNADDIIYNDLTTPNSQVGDFRYDPEGGHLHNWRPFVYDDPYNFNDAPDETPAGDPEVTAVSPSDYNDTVTRFTIDNTGWDYYVGGYADGDRNNGYAVYLGGHKYAACGSGSGDIAVDPEPHVHNIEFEFTKDVKPEYFFTLTVKYNGFLSLSIPFSTADLGSLVVGATPLDFMQIDLTSASVDGKKLKDVVFRNLVPDPIVIDSITFSWTGGEADQKFKKITDWKTDIKHYDKPEVLSGVELTMTDFNIDAYLVSAGPVGCTDNDDCDWTNIAGVRYVLNTLFNIKYQISSREYVRAAPILNHPYLYQGSFEYPSYQGHFRRYDVTLDPDSKEAEWDTAVGGIKSFKELNIHPHARQVFTAKNVSGVWSKTDFDLGNIAELRSSLDLTPDNGDDSDELAVIIRLRGNYWDNELGQWVELENKLGGIMHSAPVIVDSKNRVSVSRDETAFVGDLYGMLHAIDTATGHEKWAYIPRNLLGKLKNDRTDPNAVHDFAGVDASPTAKDVYYDHDDDGDDEWRTILAGSQGFGGKYIYALDVTDPDNWFPLWEVTDLLAPGGGMGHAYCVAIDKVKWPVRDVDDLDGDGDTDEIIGYEIKWVVFLSAGFADIAVDHGGINVFAFDLKTGTKLWHFSSEYADAVNDIPGAVTVFDHDGDSFMDRVYVGDMNGRLWEIDAIDGTNPNGTEGTGDDTKEIPLYNAGMGNPISVSPAIVQYNGHTLLIFGTGGANWAADDQAYAIYAVDATAKQSEPIYTDGAGTLAWKVDTEVGEKIWSTPTVANGYIFLATAFGSMEGSDPRMDVPVTGQASGNFYKLKLGDGSLAWKLTAIGKVRGSIFVNRQHAYMTTIDGQIIQIGGDDFAAGTGSRVVLRSWKQM